MYKLLSAHISLDKSLNERWTLEEHWIDFEEDLRNETGLPKLVKLDHWRNKQPGVQVSCFSSLMTLHLNIGSHF